MADRFALADGPVYRLQRCRDCGMVYLNPRPTEAASGRFYQHEAYLPFASLARRPTALQKLYDGLRRCNLNWKRRLVARLKSGGALLDVGCGTGEFLACMRAAGWRVTGLERDARAANWGRRQFELDIHVGSVADLPPGRFDLITLWHVLEHLYAPRAVLQRLREYLADEGVLILAVPNLASLDAAVYGADWIALDTPRHVNHFTPATLTRLAHACGFAVRELRQLPLDAFFNTLMSEQLQRQTGRRRAARLPLRLLRAGGVTAASLFAGSRISPFSCKGATLVAILQTA
ncbi:MAG: class I SAM-dependent methyltransferase [candidate division KSB1 bacterium]|nr:class I SAM-dependent methyltransferase [candidate division KSB1 bacterium]MDZ7275252.1 class I SAM-dependent methyltransferase [candidate division KSB1 bacterium]MDZ7287420.1 class I SAM-dependent methyltransferase [candidate division KSB1 bacterium]MDZ7299534.1 class I SAM-dependent methyltransferase [candidate division KSB1 bacterium]MDZ7309119.1 class I SAM-dependent methyltransferase [candidate division KSB1 bacterium]